jgi:hypothetical protein
LRHLEWLRKSYRKAVRLNKNRYGFLKNLDINKWLKLRQKIIIGSEKGYLRNWKIKRWIIGIEKNRISRSRLIRSENKLN